MEIDKKAPVISAIDVGTNSFHMATAAVNSRGMLQVLSRDKVVVRLGSSGTDMKLINEDAMERGLNALDAFAKIARSANANIRAVATSAVREAENKDEFLRKVKDATGIDIEVVSGVEEGRLIYTGVVHALPVFSRQTLVIDIGGGSCETVIGLEGKTRFVHSEKVGHLRLTKRFFPDGATSEESVRECAEYIKGEWSPVLKRLLETGFDVAVGCSGTIENIALMALAEKGKDAPEIINGLSVDAEDIFAVIEKIKKTHTPEERSKFTGIDDKRADTISAGALILECALKTLKIEELLISSFALREGIIFDTIEKGKYAERPHLSFLRRDTIYNLCRTYDVDLVHAEQVKKIALEIFDGLKAERDFGPRERETLEAAALLHDVGYHISRDRHHKHSYYIISHCVMPGFTNGESELIANIARYHRKSHPKQKHSNFSELDDRKKCVVRFCAGILRIAEGIDRRQIQNVKNVKVLTSSEDVNIYLYPDDGEIYPDIELWGAIRRKPLLEETLNKKINFFIIDE